MYHAKSNSNLSILHEASFRQLTKISPSWTIFVTTAGLFSRHSSTQSSPVHLSTCASPPGGDPAYFGSCSRLLATDSEANASAKRVSFLSRDRARAASHATGISRRCRRRIPGCKVAHRAAIFDGRTAAVG